MVRAIHDRVIGTMPDGTPYAATDPHLLEWVHVAEVDSFLLAHQRLRHAAARPGRTATSTSPRPRVVARKLGVRRPADHRGRARGRARGRFRARADASPTTPARPCRYLIWHPDLPLAARPAVRRAGRGRDRADAGVDAREPLGLPMAAARSTTGSPGRSARAATRTIRWAMTSDPPSWPGWRPSARVRARARRRRRMTDSSRARWPLPDHLEVRDALLAAYGDPARGYHDARPPDRGARPDRRARGAGVAGDGAAVRLAAWFHDGVYDGERGRRGPQRRLGRGRRSPTPAHAAEVGPAGPAHRDPRPAGRRPAPGRCSATPTWRSWPPRRRGTTSTSPACDATTPTSPTPTSPPAGRRVLRDLAGRAAALPHGVRPRALGARGPGQPGRELRAGSGTCTQARALRWV